eukprot:5192999-Amphidinium_carterae.1
MLLYISATELQVRIPACCDDCCSLPLVELLSWCNDNTITSGAREDPHMFACPCFESGMTCRPRRVSSVNLKTNMPCDALPSQAHIAHQSVQLHPRQGSITNSAVLRRRDNVGKMCCSEQ